MALFFVCLLTQACLKVFSSIAVEHLPESRSMSRGQLFLTSLHARIRCMWTKEMPNDF